MSKKSSVSEFNTGIIDTLVNTVKIETSVTEYYRSKDISNIFHK